MADDDRMERRVSIEHPNNQFDMRPVPDPTVLTTQQLSVAIDSLRALFEVRLSGMDRAVDILQSMANRSPTIGEVVSKYEERAQQIDKIISFLMEQVKGRHAEIAEESKNLRELIEGKFSVIGTALKGMDAVSEQRFMRVDSQFIERDKRAEQLAAASALGLTTALSAQKEAAAETQKSSSAAIAKSEGSTAESIKQLQTLFQTTIAGLSAQVLDVKSRLDKGEGKTSISDPATMETLRALKDLTANLATSRDGTVAASAAKTAQTSFIIAAVVAAVSLGGLVLTFVTRNTATTSIVSDDYSTVQNSRQTTDLLQRLEQRLNALQPAKP